MPAFTVTVEQPLQKAHRLLIRLLIQHIKQHQHAIPHTRIALIHRIIHDAHTPADTLSTSNAPGYIIPAQGTYFHRDIIAADCLFHICQRFIRNTAKMP